MLWTGRDWRSSKGFVVSAVTMGMFTDLFLWGVIIPILPFIVKDRLQVPPEEVEESVAWLLSSNSLGALLFSPIAGFLADKVSSRRYPFLLGLTALILATILLEFGKTLEVLLVARIFQGISGAIVWTVGLALCLETVGSDRLGLTMGSIWSVISLGSQAAPVIGGTMYKYCGYGGVFGVSIALLCLDLIFRLLVIEREIPNVVTPDPETVNQASEETPLLPTPSSDNTKTHEAYMLEPSDYLILQRIPLLRCLRHSGLLVALLATFVQAIVISAFDATVPILANKAFNMDSFSIGLLFLSLGIPEVVLGPVAGLLVDKKGTKLAATVGWVILGASLALLAFQDRGVGLNDVDGQLKHVAIFTILLTLSGIGITITGAPNITEASIIVERFYKANKAIFGEVGPYALLYGINSTAYNAGLSLGPVLVAYLKPAVQYTGLYLLLALLSVVVALLSSKFIGQK